MSGYALDVNGTLVDGVAVEKSADGWHYVCVLDEPDGGGKAPARPAPPSRVALFWDASASRARRRPTRTRRPGSPSAAAMGVRA